mmetsp:Transcript_12617/g.27419  ORF Transcript_12617/g.27419 Transcript_12617/m.27419 type:complete len:233 (-) Transcript_12617:1393-2091(-)
MEGAAATSTSARSNSANNNASSSNGNAASSSRKFTIKPFRSYTQMELIERHAKTLVEMEGSGFSSILKVVASSPAVGSVAAASASGRLMMASPARGALGMGAGSRGMLGGMEPSENGVVIDRDRIADLAAMYDLFSRVPSSVNHLRDALSERIRLDGRALVRDQETNVAPPAAFVKGVLDMRERFAAVVSDAMRGEKKGQKRMREAFEDFLNADARAANCLQCTSTTCLGWD